MNLSFRFQRRPLPGLATLPPLIAALLLAACGQRGPLYLPPPPGAEKTADQPNSPNNAAQQPRLPAKADDGVKNAPSNDNNFKTPAP